MADAQSAESMLVLVVDDEDSLRTSIVLNLELAGYGVKSVDNAERALSLIQQEKFDIVLCDLRLPDLDGMTFIEKCRETDESVAIVLMTGFGSNDLAIEAMRKGAYDYLSKPFSPDELVFTLRKIEERERLRTENEELKSVINEQFRFSNIVAKSKKMQDVFQTVKRLANFNTTVLITGQSGTGKELLARAIHHNSPRRGKPFIAINCGAIPETLMESELFGHKKGAFTDATRDKKGLFEEANGGTLFLDEIGEMPVHLQVKLLRALQEQQIRRVGDELPVEIDVRVVAATLRDLEKDVENGRFREDLFYRLNVVSIHLPALKDRPEDIPVLIEHFMKKHNKRLGLSIQGVTPEALRCLMNYQWRGNIRELENCIERALVLTESSTVDVESLPNTVRYSDGEEGRSEEGAAFVFDDSNLSIKHHSRELEIQLIRKALAKTDGNRTHAAKILEISHRALLYKLKEYELTELGKK
ncbi:MAG: sigma-54-dependent Fis family transcriptional regulator [Bdellovibrionales bacterium]|nr:sigma-54-dependent Fis family transcriptional regulator [Bdellovibrionales bacterium]